MRTVGKAVGEYERLLSARDPEKVLARGYALVEGPDGRLVRDVDSVEVGQTLKTRLHTGTIVSTVTGKEY